MHWHGPIVNRQDSYAPEEEIDGLALWRARQRYIKACEALEAWDRVKHRLSAEATELIRRGNIPPENRAPKSDDGAVKLAIAAIMLGWL